MNTGPITRAALALEKAMYEHGAPNSFQPSELWHYGCDMGNMEIGRNAVGICHAFNERYDTHLCTVQYRNRRFHVVEDVGYAVGS